MGLIESLGGIFGSLEVSASGMKSQRTRLETVASNIANASTTRTPEGGYYKKRIAMLSAKKPTKSFNMLLSNKIQRDETENLRGVEVSEVKELDTGPKLIYEPNHPDADENGMVAYPDINIVEEMVELIMTTRAFEANLTVFNAAKQMISQSLEI